MTSRADEPLSPRILSLLREKGNRVLSANDIHERLGDPALSRADVEAEVDRLERSGAIVAARGKRYSLLEFTTFRAGKVRVFPEGYGIVYGAEGESDLYIDRRQMKGAMNGDVVLVRLDPRRPKTKTLRQREYAEGEIARILQREHSTVVGRFHQGNPPFLRPFDTRLDEDIEIDPESTMGAREGEMVNVDIERYPGSDSLAFGRVIEKLGMLGEPGVDIEVVIRKFHTPHEFPPDVLAAAE
ncbi:MAG TPA: hypothetical protein VLV48_05950, partial [Thermoanaerobaculia bacterium]|nr:hypothetical protein [Thermoanaerobaculia bacterium]